MKIFLLVFIFAPLTTFANCRLGAGEEALTIARVMRNFGSFTLKADSITLRATNPWNHEPTSEAEMNEAIEKLGFAIGCAEEVLKDPTGDVLPSRISSLTDEKEKAELVDDYVYFMTDFKEGLLEYREIFQKLQQLKPSDRNFTDARLKLDDLNEIVNRAHRKL